MADFPPIVDRNVQHPNRFTKLDVDENTVDLVPEPGAVTAAGTTLDAAWFTLLKLYIDDKEPALNRTITGNDNTTGTVVDTGENLSIPIPVTTVAPSASTTQTPAGTRSLRAQIKILVDNIAALFNFSVPTKTTLSVPNANITTAELTISGKVASVVIDVVATATLPTTFVTGLPTPKGSVVWGLGTDSTTDRVFGCALSGTGLNQWVGISSGQRVLVAITYIMA